MSARIIKKEKRTTHYYERYWHSDQTGPTGAAAAGSKEHEQHNQCFLACERNHEQRHIVLSCTTFTNSLT